MSRLVDMNFTPTMLSLIADIDAFKGQWQHDAGLDKVKLQSLKRVATIESIGSSTRIEGVKLSDIEVEQLLNNLSSTSFQTRDEQEVAGYAEAMEMVYESWSEMRLSENHIKQLHKCLLQFSAKDQRHRGEYKKFSNSVEAFDESGQSLGVVFSTATPFDTPGLMKTLIEETHEAFADKILHPLIVVAGFLVRFLAIHPFQDGNGRLSRILTTLLLLKANYLYVPYASLESIIEKNKQQYYLSLRRTQSTLNKEQTHWSAWVEFFLHCLKKQAQHLAVKLKQFKVESTVNMSVSKLAADILQLLADRQRASVSEMVETLDAARGTVKVRLNELLEQGLITRQGVGRGTWYTLKARE